VARHFRSWRREEHPNEWIFTALAYGRGDLVAKGDPDMNWNEPHPQHGTPLHAIGGKGIELEVAGYPHYSWTNESSCCITDLLALFEFALKRGADPSIICPNGCSGVVRFRVVTGDTPSPLYDLRQPVAGRSSISLWLAFSQQAKELDDQRPNQLPLASSFFDGILALLLRDIPKHKGIVQKRQGRRGSPAMVELPEATASMWQKMMMNEESCDVILQCVGGDVRVHSAIVASSSKVLSAMLQWPRDESREPWQVPLEDSKEAVEAWRLLVYTGLPPADGFTTDLLLEVLDLSHRWQDHLLECGLLTTALAKHVVDADSCGRVLEAALTKDLPELRSECLAFARRSRELRRDWEQGHFSGETAKHLGNVLGASRKGTERPAGLRRWDL